MNWRRWLLDTWALIQTMALIAGGVGSIYVLVVAAGSGR